MVRVCRGLSLAKAYFVGCCAASLASSLKTLSQWCSRSRSVWIRFSGYLAGYEFCAEVNGHV